MSTERKGERLDLSSHEFAIPCRASNHAKYGSGDAAWIAWQFQCCDKRPAFGFVCDPCLQQYLNTPNGAKCTDCGTRIRPARHAITRFERLDRSTK